MVIVERPRRRGPNGFVVALVIAALSALVAGIGFGVAQWLGLRPGNQELESQWARLRERGMPEASDRMRMAPLVRGQRNAAPYIRQIRAHSAAIAVDSASLSEIRRAAFRQEWERVGLLCQRFGRSFEAMHRAAECDVMDFERDRDQFYHLQYPELGLIARTCSAMLYHGEYLARNGDADGAIEQLEAVRHVAVLLSNEWSLMAQLNAASIDRGRLRAVRRLADHWLASKRGLARLDAHLAEPGVRIRPKHAVFDMTYLGMAALRNRKAEQIEAEMLRKPGEELAPLQGAIVRHGWPSGVVERTWLAVHFRIANDHLDILESDQSPRKQWEAMRTLELKTRKPTVGIGRMAKLFWGSVSAVLSSGLRLESEQVLTDAYVRLHAYRAEHGVFPPRLEELRVALVDPCSEKPLVYTPSADGFVLYALGLDAKDGRGARGDLDILASYPTRR